MSYTPISDIAATGNQYFDTGIYGNQDTNYEVGFYPISTGGYIFGARTKNTQNALTLFWGGIQGDNVFYADRGSTRYESNKPIRDYIASLQNRVLTLNDTVVTTFPAEDFTTPTTIKLFAIESEGGIVPAVVGTRIAYCKFWDGDTLIRDFVPAKDENGVVCFWDTVTNKYYYKQSATNGFDKKSFLTGIAVGMQVRRRLPG